MKEIWAGAERRAEILAKRHPEFFATVGVESGLFKQKDSSLGEVTAVSIFIQGKHYRGLGKAITVLDKDKQPIIIEEGETREGLVERYRQLVVVPLLFKKNFNRAFALLPVNEKLKSFTKSTRSNTKKYQISSKNL